MRRLVRITAALLLILLALLPEAGAATLIGRPFFVFHSLAAGTATVFIFTAAGAFCGAATIAGVGPPGGATLAFEKNLDVLLEAAIMPAPPAPPPPPLTRAPLGGVWYTVPAGPPVCGGGSAALASWYVDIL